MENQNIKSTIHQKQQDDKPKDIHPTSSNNGNTLIRYSDEELKEFRELISAKLHKSRIDYKLLAEALSLKDDHGTNDTSPTFKLTEDAGDLFSREEISHQAIRQRKYIEHLENALIRIENKTYGICSITGKLIPKERLRSVPHSTMSMNAKLGL